MEANIKEMFEAIASSVPGNIASLISERLTLADKADDLDKQLKSITIDREQLGIRNRELIKTCEELRVKESSVAARELAVTKLELHFENTILNLKLELSEERRKDMFSMVSTVFKSPTYRKMTTESDGKVLHNSYGPNTASRIEPYTTASTETTFED